MTRRIFTNISLIPILIVVFLVCETKSDLLGQHDVSPAYRKAIALEVDLIQTDDVSGEHKLFKEIESAGK